MDNDGLVDWVGGVGGGVITTKIRPMLIGHEIRPVNGSDSWSDGSVLFAFVDNHFFLNILVLVILKKINLKKDQILQGFY